LDRLPS